MPDLINGPGTENYAPAKMLPDAFYPSITANTATPANGIDGNGNVPNAKNLVPPDPSEGGAMGQFNRLGWSTGFLKFRRHTSFDGRVVTPPPPSVVQTGPVGRSNRQARLRARMQALITDYTPSVQAVIDEVERTL